MTRRVRQAPRVVMQQLDGELLLLAPAGDAALHLDAVASTVWRLLSDGPTRPELVQAMTERYAVSAQEAASDLDAMLALLSRHGVTVEDDEA